MFAQVFIIAFLFGMAPGPDFFIVTKNSLGYGKKIGVASALGISSALLIHAFYTILGLAYILMKYESVYKGIQLLGAVYLLYLGIYAIKTTLKEKEIEDDSSIEISDCEKSFFSGFRNGFICNILNPKAILFFLSIFSQFITPGTPQWMQWVYGIEVILAVGGWFIILSMIASSQGFRQLYYKNSIWIDRFFGAFLIFFALKICGDVLI